MLHFSEKRKQEDDNSKAEPSSPKRSKRLTPSPVPQSSSSSVCSESDNEKPVSAFYRSFLESSYANDGKIHLMLIKIQIYNL